MLEIRWSEGRVNTRLACLVSLIFEDPRSLLDNVEGIFLGLIAEGCTRALVSVAKRLQVLIIDVWTSPC